MNKKTDRSSQVTRRGILKTSAAGIAAASMPAGFARAQTPKRGGTLRVSNGGDPPDLDMHQSLTYLTEMLGAPCYSTLHKVDPNDYNRLIPDLADKYEVAPDGKAITFHLNRKAVFHNGMPLTADDVIFTLDRIRNPPAGVVSPRKGLLSNIESLSAPDTHTVLIKLKEPQPDFPFLVSNPYNSIYCRAVTEPLDKQGQGMKRQIIGTGPFQLTRAIDGQIYEFARFDKYFGKPAHIDKIQNFPIKGEVERSAALQGNRIDACFFFSNDAVLQALRKTKNMVVVQRPSPTFINVIPNVTIKPFDDIRVRQAISLAIDRDAFIKTVGPLAGSNFHSLGLMLPGSPYSLTAEEVKQFAGFDTLPGLGGDINANRKRAIELLEQAGVPKGHKVTLIARADLSAFRDASINVAAQLKTIGLDTTVDVRDAAAFYELENSKKFDIVVHSVGLTGALPDQILGEGYTSYGGRNYGGWKNDEIDALFRQQSRESDSQKRKELIRQFQLTFMKTYFQVNLAWVGYGGAHSTAMKGWNALPDIYANMQLDNVWLES